MGHTKKIFKKKKYLMYPLENFEKIQRNINNVREHFTIFLTLMTPYQESVKKDYVPDSF